MTKESVENSSSSRAIPSRGDWFRDQSLWPVSSDPKIQESLRRRQELIEQAKLQGLRQEIRNNQHELDV